MATICLRSVTKIYPRPSAFDRLAHGRGLASGQVNGAFAGRVAARTAGEHDRAGRGGSVMALDHASLIIPDGQMLAVVGPSGCGKTALLRVIAGLEMGFTGHVFYDDQDVGDVPPKERYIGMLFQNYALYPHFKSRGNMGFFFRMRRALDEEAEERIRATSEVMGTGSKALLGRKPHLFLFDEPLSSLDAKLRARTRVEIKRLLRRFQITALYVTHNQMEAVSLGKSFSPPTSSTSSTAKPGCVPGG